MSEGELELRGGTHASEGGAPPRHAPSPELAAWRRFLTAGTREEFCQTWLGLQVKALHQASAGLLLLGPADRGPYAAVAHWPVGDPAAKRLGEAAERALVDRKALIQGRTIRTGRGETKSVVHLALPIVIDNLLHGVVVVEVAPQPEAELQSALRQVQWGAAWLENRFRREDSARSGSSASHLKTVLDLVAASVEREGFQSSATAFVNEAASRLRCDRVSLGLVRRGRLHVRCMSNTSLFDKKTNLVRSIEAAMDEAFDQEEAVLLPPLPDEDFQVTLAHQELARHYGTGALCSVPLGREGEIFGVLTLERPGRDPFDRQTVDLVEAMASLVGPILEMERRDERWIAKKALESAWKQLQKLTGPEHAIAKTVAVVLVLLTVFFAVARTEYNVSAKSVIEAEFQRAAVSPFNGYVKEAGVRAGDLVQEGDVLAVLDDRDLLLERHKFASQRDQLRKQHDQALATRNAADVKIVTAQIAQVDAQLALVDDQLSRTKVTSPMTGIVVNGDLSQAIGSPTERGQVLFEIAPLESYRMILEVDERDVGDVQVGDEGQLVLSAFPSETMPFEVEKITPVSLALEGRNYFRVEARLDVPPGRLRPGMEGIGKVHAGRRHLIWIWTHRAIEWLRLFFWKWTP